jgi:type IV pilus assembly protein PilO
MDIKLPTNQRDQLMLFGSFAFLGLIVVYYMYVFSPKKLEMDTLAARIDTLTTQNESARRDVARGTATQIRQEAERYGRVLALMRQLVPTANEVPTLIEQISTTARRVGFDLQDIRPLGIIRGDVFDTHKYNLSLVGPYHDVASFLTGVGSMTRIVAPMNLSLVGADARGGGTAEAGERLLRATFEIQTYVAKRGGS